MTCLWTHNYICGCALDKQLGVPSLLQQLDNLSLVKQQQTSCVAPVDINTERSSSQLLADTVTVCC